ncbi:MAG: dTDP-4-amino-4,6-dideoxygalactose transaminase [Bacteriovorax sp.]|nr:dTDP-4-amino-4,6-dideoxygalactose transaminase [Bacteriovorax sp.]
MIPFNIPPVTGNESKYIMEAIANKKLSGDGAFNKKCSQWFMKNVKCLSANLTPSCTASLEMAFIIIDLKPGDEVIMPSFTFTSTANAVALFGGIPVFIDIDPETLNMDVNLIEEAITPKTKAIVPVHYAGMTCDMDKVLEIAKKNNLFVIEDAAQGMFAKYKGRHLGTLGDISAISFHETKNIVCGEGGAILINNPALMERADIVRDKGSNRQQFLRGEVDKYTWQDKGSSYLLSELAAAFLLAQLEVGEKITKTRLAHWNKYNEMFKEFEDSGMLKRQSIPEYNEHNAHIFYAVFATKELQQKVHQKLLADNIKATMHYVPLHSSPAGKKFGRIGSSMNNSDILPERLLRFPMYKDLPENVFEKCYNILKTI